MRKAFPCAALVVILLLVPAAESDAASAANSAATSGSVPATAYAAIPVPTAPVGLPATIEGPARYVGQTSCDTTDKPGAVRFRNMILRTYPGTWVGMNYPCGANGTRSEHYEGRALDWGVSIRNPVLYTYARAFKSWLMRTDARGNPFAMARRLGVMYVIYYNKIWGAWSGQWEEYLDCDSRPSAAHDNLCHRDHMHISLSWNGAIGHTSFWSKQVSRFDYGPCRTRDLNWAASRRAANLHECTYYPRVKAPGQASATKRLLLRYSGAGLIYGRTGPIVTALQNALHVPTTGRYTLVTKLAVVTFQIRHHLLPTGTMNVATWRMLLRVVR